VTAPAPAGDVGARAGRRSDFGRYDNLPRLVLPTASVSPRSAWIPLERAANDFLLDLVYEKVFERFPNVRVASIENGSSFLPNLLRHLEHAKQRNPWHFDEDPVVMFREHVWINPFWEDDIQEVIELMGPERVIYGSDWPHMEGLPEPGGILDEIDGLDERTRNLFLHDSTRQLTKRRPA